MNTKVYECHELRYQTWYFRWKLVARSTSRDVIDALIAQGNSSEPRMWSQGAPLKIKRIQGELIEC
jgi:hypothetical protein